MKNKKNNNGVNYKRRAIIALLLVLPMLAIFDLGRMHQHIDLTEVDNHTGRITELGITKKKCRRAKLYNPKVFYVTIEGVPETLGVYRRNKDYNSLLNQLKVGDVVTVFYKNYGSCNVNTDLIQINKNDTIVLDKSEYESKESNLIWIGLGMAGCFICIAVWNFRKYSIEKKESSAGYSEQ